RYSSGQAGHYVANLGRVEYIQTFDGEWNAAFRKFMNQLFAMAVNTRKHSKLAPAAALFLTHLLDAPRKVGGLDLLVPPGNNFHEWCRRAFVFLFRLLVAQRFQRSPLVADCISLLREHWRFLIHNAESAT